VGTAPKPAPAAPKRSRAGRPRRPLTREIIEAIGEAYRLGAPQEQAAGLAQVSGRQLRYWLAAGADEDARLTAHREPGDPEPSPDPEKADYLQLFRHIREQDAKHVTEGLALIRRAAVGQQVKKRTTVHHKDGSTTVEETFTEGQWSAMAWILERRHWRDFARHTISELTGADGGPIQSQAEVTNIDQQSLLDQGRARIMELHPEEAAS
jgi:hypothetical protein